MGAAQEEVVVVPSPMRRAADRLMPDVLVLAFFRLTQGGRASVAQVTPGSRRRRMRNRGSDPGSAVSGSTGSVQQQGAGSASQRSSFFGCGNLIRDNLAMGDLADLVSGRAIHRELALDFKASVSHAVMEDLWIPGASADPMRTFGLCGGHVSMTRPEIIEYVTNPKSKYKSPLKGDGISAAERMYYSVVSGSRALLSRVFHPLFMGTCTKLRGRGIVDLARLLPGGTLQIAELKPASFECAADGLEQVTRYVDQVNQDDPDMKAWKAAGGVRRAMLMPENTYGPTFRGFLNLPSYLENMVEIRTAWCQPGLIVYGVTARDPDPEPIRKPVKVPVPFPVPLPGLGRAAGRILKPLLK